VRLQPDVIISSGYGKITILCPTTRARSPGDSRGTIGDDGQKLTNRAQQCFPAQIALEFPPLQGGGEITRRAFGELVDHE
jgi:hypothetical protein